MTMPAEPSGVTFNAGFMSGRGDLSPGLEQTSARWNSMIKENLGKPPPSVLAQTRLSNVASNASAPSVSDRVMPDGTLLPSTNGTGASTYEGDNQLRLRGALPL